MTTRRRRKQGRARPGSAAANARKRAREFRAFDVSTLNIPQGVNFWYIDDAKPKRIDILAYKVGKGNPAADEGTYHYERTYWAHGSLGSDGKTMVVCLKKTFGKKCAACELVEQLKTDPDCSLSADEIKRLEPKIRQVFNIIDVASPASRRKGVQIWDFSFHKFGRKLDGMINDEDEDDEYHTFADWIGGKTLKLGIEDNKTYGKSVDRIEFKPRKNYNPKIMVKKVLCLDDLIKEVSYEEQKKLIQGTISEDQDEELTAERNKAMKKIRKMTKVQLKKFIKVNELGVDVDDFDDLEDLREAVADEVAEAAMADEPEDQEFDEGDDGFDEGEADLEVDDEDEVCEALGDVLRAQDVAY